MSLLIAIAVLALLVLALVTETRHRKEMCILQKDYCGAITEAKLARRARRIFENRVAELEAELRDCDVYMSLAAQDSKDAIAVAEENEYLRARIIELEKNK